MVTLGEYRVGIKFNPSNNSTVDKIKRAAADLIDLIEEDIVSTIDWEADRNEHMWFNEVARLKSLALTRVEEAAMWAVKAATKDAYDV